MGRLNTATTSLVPPSEKFVSNTLTSSQPSSPNRFNRSLNFWPSILPPRNQPEASNMTVEYSHFINCSRQPAQREVSGRSQLPLVLNLWVGQPAGSGLLHPPRWALA